MEVKEGVSWSIACDVTTVIIKHTRANRGNAQYVSSHSLTSQHSYGSSNAKKL